MQIFSRLSISHASLNPMRTLTVACTLTYYLLKYVKPLSLSEWLVNRLPFFFCQLASGLGDSSCTHLHDRRRVRTINMWILSTLLVDCLCLDWHWHRSCWDCPLGLLHFSTIIIFLSFFELKIDLSTCNRRL